MKTITIFGAGLVGGPMARNLATDFHVRLVDVNASVLKHFQETPNLETLCANVVESGVARRILKNSDFAVNAVPGFLGFATLKQIVESGVHGVDLAFMPENVLDLDKLAREHNVCFISDMGVAPGMSNVLAGRAAAFLEPCENLEIMVGGLPRVRHWPWEYKAVFSPADVIEEYTRPARLVRGGKIVTLPALSDVETVDFDETGSLEAFNSDGLRSLITTLDIPDMVEKTLRYPGHAALMRVLRHAGFFDSTPVELSSGSAKPLELSSKLLFKQWKLQPGEEDLTIMRVVANGRKNGKSCRLEWRLFDTYDTATGVHSMARTTGYAAAAALRLIAQNLFCEPGIHMPEVLGKNDIYVNFLLSEQEKLNIKYTFTQT